MKKDNSSDHIRILGKTAFVGIGIAVLFWILESVIHLVVFRGGTLIEQIFPTELNEMWMRLFTVCLIIIFGLYAQFTINERKRAEELFRTLSNSSPVGVYITQDGKFQYLNPMFQELTGYREDELLGTDSLTNVYPTDREMVRANAIAMLKGKNTQPYEYRVFNHARDIRFIMETVASIRYRGRRAVLANYMDITERKRAEERIQHLNLALQAIRNVNQLITREKDRDQLLEGICHNLTETRGYHTAWIVLFDESGGFETAAEAGLGGDFLPMIERLKRGELPDCARRALEQPDIVVIDEPLSTCTGCPLSSFQDKGGAMAVRLAHTGKVYGLLVVSMPSNFVSDEEEHSLFQELAGDITFALHSMELEDKRKQAEEALRESEEKYRALVENATDFIFLIDKDNRILSLNQSAATLFGKKPRELIGKTLFDIFPREIAAGFSESIKEVFQTEKVSTSETKMIAGEKEMWISTSLSPVRDHEGKVVAVMGVTRDITERQRAEEALRESEEKYRALVENATDFIYLCDKDNKILSLNQSAATLFGKKPRELIGKTLFDIFPREIAAGFSESIKEVFQTEKVRASETKMIAGEKEMWISASLSPVRDHEGKVVAVMGVTRDITERKQAEEQEQLMALFAELNPAPVMRFDRDGRVLMANPAALEILGIESVDGTSLSSIFPSVEDFDPAACIRDGAILSHTVQIGNRHFHFVLRGVPELNIGQIYGSDITERKRAEETLRESEERYRSIFDKAPVSLILMDKDGQMVEVNPYHITHIGRGKTSLEDYLGKNIITFPPIVDAGLSDTFAGLLKGKPFSLEGVYIPTTSGGTDRYLNIKGIPLFKDGDVIGAISIQEDITERKQAEEARCELDRLKSEFISNISHELRSPLHSIRGFSNLILDGKVPDPETQKEFLTIIDRQSEHLGSLVDNLLDMSRIEAGQFSIQKRLTPISNIIHSAIETFYTMADEKGILITEDIPSALPEIEVDEERLKQVMMNLLSNAIKFSKDVGPVTVKVEARDAELLVQVTDRGIGIPKKAMPRLFERFQQAEAASRIGGAGLGLYISKQIIEAHGGRIWAKSKEGKGSTFNFTLPLGQEGGNSHE